MVGARFTERGRSKWREVDVVVDGGRNSGLDRNYKSCLSSENSYVAVSC